MTVKRNEVQAIVPIKIPDPGNGKAIPVNRSGYVILTTAAAETRTLAAPTHIGQSLMLIKFNQGNNCVVTVSAAVNQTGNNTLTFDDAGDTMILFGKVTGTTLRWGILHNDTVPLSTV